MSSESKGGVLVTGGARRIGAAICRSLHSAGYDIAVHYHRSADEAEALAGDLNRQRDNSCRIYQADLCAEAGLESLCDSVLGDQKNLYGLVNNASVFTAAVTPAEFDTVINSNLRAPWYLCRRLASTLQQAGGAIVNIVDAHTRTPAAGYEIYDASKQALAGLTRRLATELAPAVRVNAVAPGAILWPEQDQGLDKQAFVQQIPLQRLGDPADIAAAVLFLLDQAPYVTGQVLAVDGGRGLAP